MDPDGISGKTDDTLCNYRSASRKRLIHLSVRVKDTKECLKEGNDGLWFDFLTMAEAITKGMAAGAYNGKGRLV
jgi:hypothetical protein